MPKRLTKAYVKDKVWAHNRLFGDVRRMELALRKIATTPTVVEEGQNLAAHLLTRMPILKKLLETRDDSGAN